MTIRLVDADGADVPLGATGEFWISGPGLMRGYLGQPEATAEVLRDGWFHTGDLGRQDERGLYYFVGRKKDIIRRSGENLAAAEVEEVLRAHPKVLEVAVIGVPDDLRGEEVKAPRGARPGWPGTKCRATSSTGPPTFPGHPRSGWPRPCCAIPPAIARRRSGIARTQT
jgi:acyl-CoA synthetase (AMP-forming)/AMP-acid ligase II